jgi:hypothetical protein
MEDYDIKVESLTPDFKIDADYVLDGQLLLLPIRGTGKCTITLGESKNCFPGIMVRENDKNLSGSHEFFLN